jgi:hypothetical protein
LSSLNAGPAAGTWPDPETEREDHLFSAATQVFVEPGRADRARRALRHTLGGQRYEHLLGLLAFIRTAHYWTVIHPDLQSEDDVRVLLTAHEELARLLMQDSEADRCDMGTRLFRELEDFDGRAKLTFAMARNGCCSQKGRGRVRSWTRNDPRAL